MVHGSKTILQEAAHSKSLFLINSCATNPIASIVKYPGSVSQKTKNLLMIACPIQKITIVGESSFAVSPFTVDSVL